jgi:prepilin-type N-terminal cleavage/methylation domain-containing protein
MTRRGPIRVSRVLEDARGFTLIELLIVMIVLTVIMTGIVNAFVSGTRAAYVANSNLNAQQDIRTGLSRLEYEGRCGSSATILAGGAGVSFALPSVCSHVSPVVSWCVVSGALTRYLSASCSGSGQVFARSVTSATPFSFQANTGDLQEVLVNLKANPTGAPAGSFSITDSITLRNSSPG